MKLIRSQWLLLALFLALAPLRPASAQTVIYSNLGPGDSFDAFTTYGVAGETSSTFTQTSIAAPFVVGDDPVQFGSVELGMQHRAGVNFLVVKLMSDSSNAPGGVLENIPVTNIPTGSPSLITAISTTHSLLTAHTKYWIVASATSNTEIDWFWNNQGKNGVAFNIGADEDWEAVEIPTPAMRVNAFDSGPAVPEPGAALLFLPALGALAIAYRRRSNRI